MDTATNHTFIILAYKESPYINACIQSLTQQTLKSGVILSTSTPSLFLDGIGKEYGIPVVNNEKQEGIAADWSFAYNLGKTKYITLAHQDDLYSPRYTETLIHWAEKYPENLITFPAYSELVDNKVKNFRLNLIIKAMIRFPFYFLGRNLKSSFLKKAILSFGSPIPCPAVMYNKKNIGEFHFSTEFSINMDWDAWLRLSRKQGEFVFVNKSLMIHRIHESSETTMGINNRQRIKEDTLLFLSIWGNFWGNLLVKLYALSYRSNR